MISDEVVELEKQVWDKFNEYFPKTKISTDAELKQRSKALVILIMAKELGVQGHADYHADYIRNIKRKEKEAKK